MYNKKNYWIRFSYDIINYQTLSLCYLLQPSALADNSDLGINNSYIMLNHIN